MSNNNNKPTQKYRDDTMLFGMVPPQDIEVEKFVLGVCLCESDSFSKVVEIIQKEDIFYSDTNVKIFKSLLNLYQSGNKIDLFTVRDDLIKSGFKEQITGYDLAVLQEGVISSAHLEDHCRILVERYIDRELIRIGNETARNGYDVTLDTFEKMDMAQMQLTKLQMGNLKKEYVNSQTMSMEVLEDIERMQFNDVEISGITSGIGLIDEITHGWQSTDFIILAARPSVGKTAFALNLALNAAKVGTGIGFFSMEMSSKQLAKRMLSTISATPLINIVRAQLGESQMRNVMNATNLFSTLKIFVDDQAALNVYNLRARAMRMKQKDNVGIIIIDYLQLMTGVGKEQSRELEISNISRNLKALAKELEIPIIALSQLNRKVEDRADKRPQLSDLRESGSLEQDTDLVMFLTRPDYQANVEVTPELVGTATLIIAKHRNGQTADVPLKFDKETQTFKGDVPFSDPNQSEHTSFKIPKQSIIVPTQKDDPYAGITPQYLDGFQKPNNTKENFDAPF